MCTIAKCYWVFKLHCSGWILLQREEHLQLATLNIKAQKLKRF